MGKSLKYPQSLSASLRLHGNSNSIQTLQPFSLPTVGIREQSYGIHKEAAKESFGMPWVNYPVSAMKIVISSILGSLVAIPHLKERERDRSEFSRQFENKNNSYYSLHKFSLVGV